MSLSLMPAVAIYKLLELGFLNYNAYFSLGIARKNDLVQMQVTLLWNY